MKRLLITALSFVCFWGLGFAQKPCEAVAIDPLKAAGNYYVYDTCSLPAPTPAPEGYKPFYISNFARHGARYGIGDYADFYKLLSEASAKGLLTEEGKALRSRYKAFYKKVRYCTGNLTEVGKAQHKGIASRMFERFPEVFQGHTHVDAVSTESARVIMSMWSCLSQLSSLDDDMDIHADASARFATWLQPGLRSNPNLVKDAFDCGKAAYDALDEYFEKTVPWKEIAGKFFTNPEALRNDLGITPLQFCKPLGTIVFGARCLDEDRDCFDDVLTREQAQLLWKGLSARFFLHVARVEGSENLVAEYAAYTLEQIIESAEADIRSGDTQLRLRFGHDSGLAPLLVFLDVNGFGRCARSLEESLEIMPNYNIPMAGSLQLVFYRNAEGNILVKALLNEQEATLPLPAVCGPYYSWDDFKEHYLPAISTAKRNILTLRPLAALKAVDWGWKPVGNTRVEAAAASVNVFGSVQSISMARFPLKDYSVSLVESDGPAAAITSSFGEKNKAIAAINGSYFEKNLMPATFVKDEGRVLCSRTSDGAYRCNGMFRIKDRRGRKVDIVSTDSLMMAKDARGWREAIVSGPVLIEDGITPTYEDDGSYLYKKFYAKRHPRTLLGYTTDGWLYFIVVDGRFPAQADGMSIFELQVLCEALGLHEAINLDGGGSSTLWTRDSGVINHPYDNQVFDHAGERVVPNVVIVK